jgi:hypothetical protein
VGAGSPAVTAGHAASRANKIVETTAATKVRRPVTRHEDAVGCGSFPSFAKAARSIT